MLPGPATHLGESPCKAARKLSYLTPSIHHKENKADWVSLTWMFFYSSPKWKWVRMPPSLCLWESFDVLVFVQRQNSQQVCLWLWEWHSSEWSVSSLEGWEVPTYSPAHKEGRRRESDPPLPFCTPSLLFQFPHLAFRSSSVCGTARVLI